MEYLRELNAVSICIRVILSLVIGGILGIERGRKNRPAGFRTYMLVCLGSALVMMTNQYITNQFGATDPARMGAQVISGIGFLGAGTIMVTGRNQVKGITTAAGLWTAACCGLAIGIGFYEVAVIGGIAIFVVMRFLDKTEAAFRSRQPRLDVYMEFNGKKTFSNFLEDARDNGLDITDIQMTQNKHVKERELCVVLTINSNIKRTHSQMLALIGEMDGVKYVEEL